MRRGRACALRLTWCRLGPLERLPRSRHRAARVDTRSFRGEGPQAPRHEHMCVGRQVSCLRPLVLLKTAQGKARDNTRAEAGQPQRVTMATLFRYSLTLASALDRGFRDFASARPSSDPRRAPDASS